MRVRLRALLPVLAVLVSIAAVDAVPASAQESLICRKRDKLLGGGNNHKDFGPGRDVVNGGGGRDVLRGGPGNDIIVGGRGNDIVYGGPGNDIVCGGIGNDKVYGDEGDDQLFGEEANDILHPGPGDDYALGSAGRDRVYGWGRAKGGYTEDGNDTIDGGHTQDRVEAGGADIVLGGSEDDILSTRTPAIAPEYMNGGYHDDRITGSDADDLIFGDLGDDVIRGLGGSDVLRGEESFDEIFGGLGNDFLYGATNADFLSGGPDSDLCNGGGPGPNAKPGRPLRRQLRAQGRPAVAEPGRRRAPGRAAQASRSSTRSSAGLKRSGILEMGDVSDPRDQLEHRVGPQGEDALGRVSGITRSSEPQIEPEAHRQPRRHRRRGRRRLRRGRRAPSAIAPSRRGGRAAPSRGRGRDPSATVPARIARRAKPTSASRSPVVRRTLSSGPASAAAANGSGPGAGLNPAGAQSTSRPTSSGLRPARARATAPPSDEPTRSYGGSTSATSASAICAATPSIVQPRRRGRRVAEARQVDRRDQASLRERRQRPRPDRPVGADAVDQDHRPAALPGGRDRDLRALLGRGGGRAHGTGPTRGSARNRPRHAPRPRSARRGSRDGRPPPVRGRAGGSSCPAAPPPRTR